MKILSHLMKRVQGYRLLIVNTDLGQLTISYEQRLLDEFGLVFCGPGTSAFLPPYEIPSDRHIGRDGWTATGFTDNPEVVALYRQYFRSEGGS